MSKESAMCDPIDIHLGHRLRRRRKLRGLTQQKLASLAGLRFQQIQKYECAANRMSAACLWRLAVILDVEVSYFYEGFGLGQGTPENEPTEDERRASRETQDLVHAFGQLDEHPRRRLLDLAKEMSGTSVG